jgi:FkbM family methyltransferase
MNNIKKIVKEIFSYFNLSITTKSAYDRLAKNSSSAIDIELLQSINRDFRSEYIDYMEHSKSQLRQDLFVLAQHKFKNNGYFVDFGATNGLDLSNTHLLEKKFMWQGILCEPAIMWHKDLKRNRSSSIDFDCVWKESGHNLTFNETQVGELSTIDSFSSSDVHAGVRKSGKKYQVKTISLCDLLDKHSAPKIIDYLSIDTEGSEYEILKKFNYDKYIFSVITCEHNFTENRKKIFNLLTSKGYKRIFKDISRFDDWYIYDHSSKTN